MPESRRRLGWGQGTHSWAAKSQCCPLITTAATLPSAFQSHNPELGTTTCSQWKLSFLPLIYSFTWLTARLICPLILSEELTNFTNSCSYHVSMLKKYLIPKMKSKHFKYASESLKCWEVNSTCHSCSTFQLVIVKLLESKALSTFILRKLKCRKVKWCVCLFICDLFILP